jgi:hypothetical protein
MDRRAAPRLGGRDQWDKQLPLGVGQVGGVWAGVTGGFLSDGIKIAADHTGFQAPSQAMPSSGAVGEQIRSGAP